MTVSLQVIKRHWLLTLRMIRFALAIGAGSSIARAPADRVRSPAHREPDSFSHSFLRALGMATNLAHLPHASRWNDFQSRCHVALRWLGIAWLGGVLLGALIIVLPEPVKIPLRAPTDGRFAAKC